VTRWIRMLETISGGRPNGAPWPPAGHSIEVEDWEAEHNTRAGWAVYADPPAPEPVPEPEPAPVPVKAAAKVPSPAPETAGEPPRPSDPKDAWVDYAASRGEDRATAAAMSKADLMSKYGGRM